MIDGKRGKQTEFAAALTPSRIEIDAQALAGNVRLLKAHIGDQVSLMAVVKANAYGHGAVAVSRTALANGADWLAVANMAEALELRASGIAAPILILNGIPAFAVEQAIQQDIRVSLFDLEQARPMQEAAQKAGGKLKVHIKVDSGMGRLGALAGEALDLMRCLQSMESLEIEGIYTHFARADEDPAHTARQLAVFKAALASMQADGFRFSCIHAANSAALIASRDSYFNLVRPGLLLYGLQPTGPMRLAGLRPVMSWKTTVAQVKTLPAGASVGYGGDYRTRRQETIAVLPVGYADGLRRSPQTWRQALIRGKRAPLIGRVSMEKTTVNVSHIPNARAGDEVVLMGRQGDQEISADEIADWLGTLHYELVASIAPRAPRI